MHFSFEALAEANASEGYSTEEAERKTSKPSSFGADR